MEFLYIKQRREWRSWLGKNAAKLEEIWLVYYKKNSGQPTISYEEAVLEALCFGWIDGKIQKLDEARYAQRFTPRKPDSRWSESNIRRVEKLIAEKKMTPAGLAVYHSEQRRETPVRPTELPGELEKRFQQNAKAWRHFQCFPAHYRRLMTGWVAGAKKEETKIRRLEKLIDYSARNERIPLM